MANSDLEERGGQTLSRPGVSGGFFIFALIKGLQPRPSDQRATTQDDL